MQITLTFQNDDDKTKVIHISIAGDPAVVKAVERKIRELPISGWTEI